MITTRTRRSTNSRNWLILFAGVGVVLLIVIIVPRAERASLDLYPCMEPSVGAPETVVSDATRDRLGLAGWPDTAFGVLRSPSGGYRFIAASAFGGDPPAPQRNVVTKGSLKDPVADGVLEIHQPRGLPEGYTWAGGGPVFQDAGTGIVLQTLHLERPLGGGSYYAELHLGRFHPVNGETTYLGPIVRPALDLQTARVIGMNADVGTSSLTPVGDYLHVYFSDFAADGSDGLAATGLSTARAPIAEVMKAAAKGSVSPWTKYHNESWSSPGLGGQSADLHPGGVLAWAPNVVRMAGGGLLMVAGVSKEEFVLSSSRDGVRAWSPRVRLFRDRGRYNAYPTVVGLGREPAVAGDRFYVYHLQWLSPDPDWSRARVVRREISC